MIALPGSGRTGLEVAAVSLVEPWSWWPGVRLAHEGDHGAGGRRRHPVRGGARPTARPGGPRSDGRRGPSTNRHARPQRDVHRDHLPGRPRRRHHPTPRGPLPPGHGLVAGRAGRPVGRLGCRRQHDRLSEVPGHATRPRGGLGLPPRVRGHGAEEPPRHDVRLRSRALEAALGTGLAGRQRPRGRPTEPAGLDADPPGPGAPRENQPDPGGGHCPPGAPPPDRRQGFPGWPGRPEARPVRRPVHCVGHRRLLPRARRHRGLGGGPPDARRLRHPRLDGHRVAPRVGPAGRDDGYDGQSALRPPPPCPRSAWRCGTSGIGRILARPWRPPRPSSTPRHRSPAGDFPRRRPAETAD